MSLELEKYYALKGYNSPKFTCTNLADTKGIKMFCAEVILPNGISIRGEPKRSKPEVSIIFYDLIIIYQFEILIHLSLAYIHTSLLRQLRKFHLVL